MGEYIAFLKSLSKLKFIFFEQSRPGRGGSPPFREYVSKKNRRAAVFL
jgi:hypothetical protein